MAFLHCRNRWGAATVTRIFKGTNPPAGPGIDFRTGDITLGTGQFSNGAYDGTPSEGSTDGNYVEDFKKRKVNQIRNRTGRLLRRGVNHNSRTFAASAEMRSYLAIGQNSSLANPTFDVPDVNGETYDIVDASDFNALVDAVATRCRSIYNDTGGGEGDLITQVTAAANTQAAMDAIVDART